MMKFMKIIKFRNQKYSLGNSFWRSLISLKHIVSIIQIIII